MIGKSTVGQVDFKKPDHGSSENTHYSCVDDITHPKIFVIFDPNQIYPEYLIQYKWRQEACLGLLQLSEWQLCLHIFNYFEKEVVLQTLLLVI